MKTLEEALGEQKWHEITSRRSMPPAGQRALFEMHGPRHFKFFGEHIGRGVARSYLYETEFSYRVLKRWMYADRSQIS